MKTFFNRFFHLSPLPPGRPAVSNADELLPDVQSPVQRAVVTAFIACLLSLMLVYWAIHAVLERLGIWWAEGLVYTIFPVSVAFIILHRSCWHRETLGALRTFSVLLLSSAMFGGVLLAIGAIIALASFCAIAIRICTGGR